MDHYRTFDDYKDLDASACHRLIHEAKHRLKDDLMILGHHYQRQEVYMHAHVHGDSLELSRLAASCRAPYIVFCGVHFMAEVADMLTSSEQITILPDLAAGCSMADMANSVTVERAWKELSSVVDADRCITPITYINSSAKLKAFCGDHGGIVCTSSNAQSILRWAFQHREKVFFFPDQHLGRYAALKIGIPSDAIVLWDFMKPLGGLKPEDIERAQVIVWNGFCSVHTHFKPEHIIQYRKQHPDVKVICHPECTQEVCDLSDAVGSTAYLSNWIRQAPEGSRILVGTEWNLVERLRQEQEPLGKQVVFMSPSFCMCSTMYRIDIQHLAWCVDQLASGHVHHPIHVPSSIAISARLALNRMLEASAL